MLETEDSRAVVPQAPPSEALIGAFLAQGASTEVLGAGYWQGSATTTAAPSIFHNGWNGSIQPVVATVINLGTTDIILDVNGTRSAPLRHGQSTSILNEVAVAGDVRAEPTIAGQMSFLWVVRKAPS